MEWGRAAMIKRLIFYSLFIVSLAVTCASALPTHSSNQGIRTTLLPLIIETGPPDEFEFVELNPLNTPRYSHTAQLLSNGQLIFIGGNETFGVGAPTNTAELLDPTSGVLAYTGEMNYERVGHSSTLLANGRILTAGGGVIQAEEYNPITGEFYPVGNMKKLRNEHEAVYLQSGKVLIVGGSSANIYDEVELYDPITGSFSEVGTMNEPRNGHTSTVLRDGRVLITGGASNGISRTAEIYDPETNDFSHTGMMNENRFIHTATLLMDGTVLITGGSNGRNSPNDIVGSAEIYDPETGLFTTVGSLNQRRMRHTATLLPNGFVLIVGGTDRGDQLLSSVELYDPITQEFTIVGNLAHGREHFSTTLLMDGTVVVAGGIINDRDGVPYPREITTSIELIVCSACLPPER